MNGSSLKDRHFVQSRPKGPLKLSNTVDTFFIRRNIILGYSYSLIIYKCLKCQTYQ